MRGWVRQGGGPPPLGHHASVSPKTRQPFAARISKLDAPALFSSRRFQDTCGGGVGTGPAGPAGPAGRGAVVGPGGGVRSSSLAASLAASLTASMGQQAGSVSTPLNPPPPVPPPALSAAQRAGLVTVVGGQGQSCDAACAAVVPGGGGTCAASVLEALNDCATLPLAVAAVASAHAAGGAKKSCGSCAESNGPEQPALEAPPTALDDDRAEAAFKCLVSRARPYQPACGASHPRTRRVCPCLPRALSKLRGGGLA